MKIPLLINSCDKYSFLWSLCLDRIKKSGLEGLTSEIYINNEELIIDLNASFISDKRGLRKFPIDSWISHLRTALEHLDGDFVMVTQDDYLLSKAVDVMQISAAVKLLTDSDEISCIHLSEYVHRADFWNSNGAHSLKLNVLKFDRYFLNMQIAVWRRRDLMNALIGDGNPWRWELFGHKILRQKYNILSFPVNMAPVDYFALIKKGKLLPNAKEYLDITEFEMITNHIGLYEKKFFEKISTIFQAFSSR